MMKLFQINVTANWDSTGRVAEGIGQVAISKGWESYIAYGRYSNDGSSTRIKIGNKWDVYAHAIQTRLFDKEGLASVKPTKNLIERIKLVNPDIIHLHNVHGYYLNYPILFEFLSKAEIPVVWTLHDCWSYTGHCSHYSFIKCNRWQSECHDCLQKDQYPISWWKDRSRQNFKDKKTAFTSVGNMTLVTVSDWLADEVKQSFLQEIPVRVIRNGIDLEVFTPASVEKKDLGLSDKFMILGVANTWSPRKGLADFIELRKRLSSAYQIVLIGLNEQQIKNLPQGIVGIKRTSNIQELAKFYSVADVYINTSVEETLGLTTVEAMACKTPSIVYNATACPEVVSEGTGIVVEPQDIECIVDILNRMQRRELVFDVENCRKRVTRFFEKDKQFGEYIKLYNEILGK